VSRLRNWTGTKRSRPKKRKQISKMGISSKIYSHLESERAKPVPNWSLYASLYTDLVRRVSDFNNIFSHQTTQILLQFLPRVNQYHHQKDYIDITVNSTNHGRNLSSPILVLRIDRQESIRSALHLIPWILL
jgi:hypothetical protein